MKNILTQIASLGSKAKFALAAVFMTTMLAAPAVQNAVTAQNTVALESYTFSENVSTDPDSEPSDTTALDVDEVARVYTWYHNRQLPDSGLNAENVNVKLAIPANAGKTQSITGTVSADNAATVSDATTINLTLDRARLEVVENSAIWRYNKGAMDGRSECQTGTVRIPENDPNSCYTNVNLTAEQQAALVSGSGWTIPEHLRPCFAYESSVSVQVRSRADAVSINKQVRPFGGNDSDWTKDLGNVKPGDDVEYRIDFVNQGNTTLSNVVVGDNLPKYTKFVPGYSYIATSEAQNDNNPSNDLVKINNDSAIVNGGAQLGNYAPGAWSAVIFRAEVVGVEAFEECGEYRIRNVGLVDSDELSPYYNTADIQVNVVCEDQPETPAYTCDALNLVQQANRTVMADVDFTATNGATFKDVQINFGDGSDVLTTTEVENIRYTYDEARNYTVTATVRFNLPNGQMVSDSGETCAKEINFDAPTTPTTPTRLPNTGAGDVAGLFAAITVAGAVAHRFFLGHRFNG